MYVRVRAYTCTQNCSDQTKEHTHILSGTLLTAQPRAHKIAHTHTPSLITHSCPRSVFPALMLMQHHYCHLTTFGPANRAAKETQNPLITQLRNYTHTHTPLHLPINNTS